MYIISTRISLEMCTVYNMYFIYYVLYLMSDFIAEMNIGVLSHLQLTFITSDTHTVYIVRPHTLNWPQLINSSFQ
jgi:hypothetical protein